MANEKDMVQAAGSETAQPTSEKFTLDYVLAQIEQIAAQTDYLNEAIKTIRDTDSEESEDNVYQKMEALKSIVESRENTNQELLRMYEKMYADFKPSKPQLGDIVEAIRQLFGSCGAQGFPVLLERADEVAAFAAKLANAT